jgi:hypothetical protein
MPRGKGTREPARLETQRFFSCHQAPQPRSIARFGVAGSLRPVSTGRAGLGLFVLLAPLRGKKGSLP